MASLHEKKGSPHLWLAYRDATGTRRMRSLGTSNPTIAAEELAKACRREERRRLGQTTSAEDRLEEAADLALDELSREYVEHLRSEERSAAHVGDVEKTLASFVEHLGAGAKLADVTPDAIRNFIGQRRARATSNVVEHAAAGPRTANRWRSLVGGFCSWLLTTDRLAANPVDRVKAAKVDPLVRRRALTDDELARLLAAADAHGERVGLWVRLGAFQGLRRGELRKLRWRNVDLDGAVLTITPDVGKAKGRRDVVPLHPVVLERLKAARPPLTLDPTALVFPERVSDELRRKLFEEAAIVVENAAGERADFHALRSTLATRLAKGGASPIATQKMLRHSAFRTTDQHYLKLTADDLREGLPGFAMPSVAPVRQAVGAERRDGTGNKSDDARCNAPGARVTLGATSDRESAGPGNAASPETNGTKDTLRERIGAGVPRGLQIRRGALQRSQVGSIPMRSRHAAGRGRGATGRNDSRGKESGRPPPGSRPQLSAKFSSARDC